MAGFLVERYGPGVSPAHARSLETGLAAVGARIVQAIVTDGDDVTFWYVEAATADDVVRAFGAAAIPVDRIAPARGDDT